MTMVITTMTMTVTVGDDYRDNDTGWPWHFQQSAIRRLNRGRSGILKFCLLKGWVLFRVIYSLYPVEMFFVKFWLGKKV